MKMNSTKKKLALSLAVAMVMSSAPVLSLQSFADVQTQKTDYEMAYEAVEALYANPYITGTDQDDIANAQEYINILPDGLAKTNLQNILNVVKVHNAVAYANANPYLKENIDKANDAMKGFTGVGAAFLKDVMVAANALYDANIILNGMWANINKLDAWDPVGFDAQAANFKAAIAKFAAAGVLADITDTFNAIDKEMGNMSDALKLVQKAKADPKPENIDAAKAAIAKVTYPAAIDNLNNLLTGHSELLKVISISAINGKEVEIKFSKAVDKSTVMNAATPAILQNITFTNIGSAPAVTPANLQAKLSEDGKTLTVVAAVATADVFNGDYAVLVPVAVTDKDGNAVEAYSSIVSLKDSVRPTIGAATYPNNNAVKFAFSESVNLANGAALEGISTLKDKDGAVVSNSGLITLSADKKSFELNMSGLTAKETYTLTIVGAKDFAGNLITPNPVTVSFVKENADTIKPEITSVTAVNDTNLIVKFSEPIDTTGTYFTLDAKQTGTPVNVTSTEATVNKDKTEVNVNIAHANLNGLGKPFNAIAGLARVDIAGYKDLSGNIGNPFNKLVNFVADTDAPEVKSTTVETIGGVRYIAVKYDEDITLAPANLTTVTYVADGVQKTLVGGIASSAVIAHTDTNIKDTILINTENYDGTGKVLPEGAYTITLPASLVADAVPNASAAKTVKATVGKLSPVDVTKPGISSATVTDNDTVTVVFSEEVTNESALNVANYTIDGVKVFDSAIFSGDKTTVVLTLKDGVIDINGARLLEIKNVADKAGNIMDAYSDTKTFTENVKPQMLSAKVVDTNKVLVTFSEGLKASTVATGDFTVKVKGTADAVTAVNKADGTVFADGETKVLLTLTTGISELTDIVTVEIADGVIGDMNNNMNNGAKTVTAQ